MRRRSELIHHAETRIPLPLLSPLAELIHRSALQHLSIAERVVLLNGVHGGIVRVAERVLAVDVEAVVGMPGREGGRVGAAEVGDYSPNVLLRNELISQWREIVALTERRIHTCARPRALY